MRQPTRRGTRPDSTASLQQRLAVDTFDRAPAKADGPADGIDRQKLVAEFEHALGEERNLSAEERDSILEQYRSALQIAPVDLAPPDIEDLRASFLEMTDSLAQEQVIQPSERDGLVRQFNAAIETLGSAEVQRSAEYARRAERDGVDAAGTWLAAQGAPVESAAMPAAPQMPFAGAAGQAPGTGLRARRRR